MNINQLSKFLERAKISTYASSGEGGENLLPDGSKEFEFRKRRKDPFISGILMRSKVVIVGDEEEIIS